MVVVGNYSVRIVEAEDKRPFKEHTGPNGQYYAEIEPDLEYFIEVDVVGGDPQKIIRLDFYVDGEKLGYSCTASSVHEKQYKGSWTHENGIDTMKAFAFQRPTFVDSKTSSARPGALMGDVKVEISEAIFAGTYTQENYKSASLKEATVDGGLTNVQTKKVLRSAEGSIEETKTRSAVSNRYSRGTLLETITINYCTALGLIHAGVLAKPEDIWAKHRMTNPAKRSSVVDENAPNNLPQPKRVKRGAKMENGVKVEAPKEVDEFDLTASSDEEDSY